jgi:DNA-directed RNA polymerase subunit RPC12/RpoP
MEIGLEGDRVVVREIKLPEFQLAPPCPKCGFRRHFLWPPSIWFHRNSMKYCPGGKSEQENGGDPVRIMFGVPINNKCHRIMGEHMHQSCERCGYEWFTKPRE